MLENIFLMNLAPKDGDNKLKYNKSYIAYPDEDDVIFNSNEITSQIITNQLAILEKNYPLEVFTENFLHKNSKALQVDGVNLLTIPLPYQYLLGLVFSLDTNPYDYRNELIRLFQEYLMNSFFESFNKENIKNNTKNKTNLLLTLFIDLRKYADESEVFQEEINRVMMDSKNNPLIKIFVYGLDFAGKSSLMRLLSTGKFDHDYFHPTKKFRITNIKFCNGISLICWDMPGQKIFRADWLRGAQASNLLMFVLDCADGDRFSEAREELWNMLNLYELKSLPLIFLVNKTDLTDLTDCKKDIKEIVKTFGLDDIHNRDCKVIFTSLPNQTGIKELKEWLKEQTETLLLINGIINPEKV